MPRIRLLAINGRIQELKGTEYIAELDFIDAAPEAPSAIVRVDATERGGKTRRYWRTGVDPDGTVVFVERPTLEQKTVKKG